MNKTADTEDSSSNRIEGRITVESVFLISVGHQLTQCALTDSDACHQT